MKKGNCYGYIRVSTKEQTEEGLSLDNQKKMITEYAKKEGYILTKIFADEGKSGRSIMKRDELIKLLNLMKKGDILIVSALSRLTRKLRDYTNICQDFEDKKIYLIVLKEKLDTTTAVGKLYGNVSAMLAQFESDLTSERVKECMKLKIERGEFLGRISYGWKLSNGKGSDLIENPEEQEIIKKIKDMRNQKVKVADVITYLEENNIKPPHNSKKWYPNTIYRIVKREGVNSKGRMKKDEEEEEIEEELILNKEVKKEEVKKEDKIEEKKEDKIEEKKEEKIEEKKEDEKKEGEKKEEKKEENDTKITKKDKKKDEKKKKKKEKKLEKKLEKKE